MHTQHILFACWRYWLTEPFLPLFYRWRTFRCGALVRIHWTGLRWGTSCRPCARSISPLSSGRRRSEVMVKCSVVFPMADESNGVVLACTLLFNFIWRRMVLALRFVNLFIDSLCAFEGLPFAHLISLQVWCQHIYAVLPGFISYNNLLGRCMKTRGKSPIVPMTNYCKLVLLNAKTTYFSCCCPPVMSVPKLRLHLEVVMKIARFKRFRV